MRFSILVLVLLFSNVFHGQKITSNELLDKSIAFHDPNGQWSVFSNTFEVLMKTPKSTDRLSIINLNIPREQFILQVEKDSVSYSYAFDKEKCTTSLNGSTKITEEDSKTFGLTCERGTIMRNYYTYLYGLPMKLRDPGTLLNDEVQTKTFKGKEYLVLKVDYEEGVGKDVWYFYFDPATYAMEVYQFYHDESKNDGEYILLEGLEDIQGIKMPKTRAWYYNKDDKYLGTDILMKN
ncbi:DUF6503 family protein [Flagellimonas pacifica]|uniref:Uncharacterized protein n=1 Tax=Flagellimonas pacifica TaxID=1247520 RepID=A0A285MDE9_9FLAO|nr:DUF6503 family protein [Allomuricauda parva]SNY95214.1 hypothetical protein SAMN06265377_0880 [Allomuricauda parva]